LPGPFAIVLQAVHVEQAHEERLSVAAFAAVKQFIDVALAARIEVLEQVAKPVPSLSKDKGVLNARGDTQEAVERRLAETTAAFANHRRATSPASHR
jgi:hypothetical protein